MIKNYFKIALRNLRKHKGYSFINIFGLAVGLACCFLIGIYLNFEFSYEDFHANKEEIYRIIPRSERNGQPTAQTWTPSALSGDLLQMREVEKSARVSFFGTGNLLTYEQKPLDNGKGIIAADSSFFQMFSYPLIRGDKKDVLDRPFEVVISKTIHEKYFRGENPIGKVIRYSDRHDFVITGVMRDMPPNSHIQADYVFSFTSLQPVFHALGVLPEGYDVLDNYSSWNYSTYVLMPHQKADREFHDRMNRYIDEQRGEEGRASNFTLQPLGDIHFETGIKGDQASGNLNFVYAFSAIALLILVIAGFNFVNLTTARSMRRAKEVGVRKSLGAHKNQLVYQFLGESLMVGLVSIVLALVLVDFFTPLFADVLNSPMTFSLGESPGMLAGLFGAGMLAAVLAGSYPAFYLSAFNPIQALKNESLGSGKSTLRKVLTGMQFAIASFLIIGTLTVYQQMDFVQNKELGFDKSQVVYLNPPREIAQDNYQAFRSNLQQYAFVESISRSNRLPGSTNSHWRYELTTSEGTKETNINTFTIDPEFVDVLDLEMAEGRNLSWDRPTDLQNGYLVNETAVRVLGLDPSESNLRVLNGTHPKPGNIVGVVEDFHYNSLHQPIEPLVMWYDVDNSWTIGIEMKTDNLPDYLETIETEWKRFAPNHPFTYSFLDDTFEQQYQAEQNFTRLLSGFTIVGIIIACLGLFGLTSYMVNQRTKEIGIRKVLGASVGNIIQMLSVDFTRLVLIAFVVVIPLAYLAINDWLQNFAYRIDQSLMVYLGSAALIMLLSLITVSWQSVRAAFTNPVEVLQDE